MTISFKCSDEAFLELVKAGADHFGDDGWEVMFGDGTSEEEVMSDPVGAMQCVVAAMEALAC